MLYLKTKKEREVRNNRERKQRKNVEQTAEAERD